MLNRTLVRQVLAGSASQLEPHLSNLERALGRPLDAASFAMGMQTATLIMQRMDVIHAVEAMPQEFAEYLAEVDRRVGRDLGPYLGGILTTGYYQPEWGMRYDPGTQIRWRKVDDRFVEVMFPPFDGFKVRWLERAQIAAAG